MLLPLSIFAVYLLFSFVHVSAMSPVEYLLARQQDIPSFPTGLVSEKCKPKCGVQNTIGTCGTISCICTETVGKGLVDCVNCIVAYNDTDAIRNKGKGILDQFSSTCRQEGHPVNANTTIDPSKNAAAVCIDAGIFKVGAGVMGAVVGTILFL